MPWYARTAAFFVLGYALSPIDLIPDFLPVVGYLDDLILLPWGVALVIRLVPADVMEESRRQAIERLSGIKFPRWPSLLLLTAFWLTAAVAVFMIFR